MGDSDLSLHITAYEHALQHAQSAVALLHLYALTRSVYTALCHDPWLHRDDIDQEPDQTFVPMILAWTERIAACCAPGGVVLPADDAVRLVQGYRSAWGYPTPDYPDDDHIFAGLITCLSRPLGGITASIEGLRRFADPVRQMEQEIAALIRLATQWSHVWQLGLIYAQQTCPDVLDQELLP